MEHDLVNCSLCPQSNMLQKCADFFTLAVSSTLLWTKISKILLLLFMFIYQCLKSKVLAHFGSEKYDRAACSAPESVRTLFVFVSRLW